MDGLERKIAEYRKEWEGLTGEAKEEIKQRDRAQARLYYIDERKHQIRMELRRLINQEMGSPEDGWA